jgi:hypothetical protein
MDTTDTIDPITGESTVKTEVPAQGQAPVEGQAPQGEKENAGPSQEGSEDGKEEGTDTRKPFRSKNQTIYELRQRIRDQEGTFSQKLEALEKRLEEMARATTRGQDQKPSRTFFEAPEDTLKAINSEQFKSFKEELLGELRQTEEERNQASQWKQETSEAAKFITSQKGITEDDLRDIEEIVRSTPEMQNLSPMQRAKYATFLWKEERGIGDKSALKQKAATVVGSPGGHGPTELTEEAINKRLDDFPKNVANWTPEDHKKWADLEREILKTKGGQR